MSERSVTTKMKHFFIGVKPKQLTEQQAFDAQQKDSALLVDVRSVAEQSNSGIPKGAVCLMHKAHGFGLRLQEFAENKLDRPIIFICRTGKRSQVSARAAARAGFSDISFVKGGVDGPGGWKDQKLPMEKTH